MSLLIKMSKTLSKLFNSFQIYYLWISLHNNFNLYNPSYERRRNLTTTTLKGRNKSKLYILSHFQLKSLSYKHTCIQNKCQQTIYSLHLDIQPTIYTYISIYKQHATFNLLLSIYLSKQFHRIFIWKFVCIYIMYML